MIDSLTSWLSGHGLGQTLALYTARTIVLVVVLLAAWLAGALAKLILTRALSGLARRSRTDLDDVLVRRRVFSRLAHFAPALVIWALGPLLGEPGWTDLLRRGAEIYMILVTLLVLDALLNSANDFYQKFEVSRRVPILGYLQVLKIIASVLAAVLVLSTALEKSPWVFLSGLGAMTAVTLLIFKDSILGLVAGIQIGANDMVRPGDWIEMPRYGADGEVMELRLNTVKIRNWDKTVSTIPSYALISDSFKNWRGMSESGGRRIKRSVLIDVNSVRFCTDEMIERFGHIERIRDYVTQKKDELVRYNEQHATDVELPINGRRMTNLGTFRAYLVAYLRENPQIHQDMTFLVRHLQPTDRGLPIEIYVFSKDQEWARYEEIQADILDHVLAALPEFDLRPFQIPAGADLERLADGLAGRSTG